jgi:hypothetical protein
MYIKIIDLVSMTNRLMIVRPYEIELTSIHIFTSILS